MTEYAVLACLIAIVAFLAVKAFGQSVNGLYTAIDGSIAGICRGC